MPETAPRIRAQRIAALACAVVLIGPKVLALVGPVGLLLPRALLRIPFLLAELAGWLYAGSGSAMARLLLGLYYLASALFAAVVVLFAGDAFAADRFAAILVGVLPAGYCAWFFLLGPPLVEGAPTAAVARPDDAPVRAPDTPARVPVATARLPEPRAHAPRPLAALVAKVAVVGVAVWLVGSIAMWLGFLLYLAR